MAEGLARWLLGPERRVYSAGSDPTQVHPLAVKVMFELGVDIRSHTAKSLEEVPLDEIGVVVTLCREEICPVFPGPVRRLHWPLPDPAAVSGTEEERLRAFREVRDEIRRRIEEWLGSGAGRSAETCEEA